MYNLHKFCFISIILSSLYLFGDVIYLKNGGKVEGIIIEESESEVTVKLGFGEMSLSRSEIDSISRTGEKDHADLEKQWKETKDKEDNLKTQYTKSVSADSGLEKGKLNIHKVTLDKKVLRESNIPSEKFKNIPLNARIGIYFPKNFSPENSWPLFIAMQTGAGGGISAISNYSKFADKLGFIVAAPELPGKADIEESRYYYILHIIDYLNKQRVIRRTQIWIGGFSGGAKWALHLGAYGGDIFSGILAIGCNHDFASLGYKELNNNSALYVPIYLLNGTQDKIAGTIHGNYKNMIESLKKTGFSRVKVEQYKGGHVIPQKETVEAFMWLKNL